MMGCATGIKISAIKVGANKFVPTLNNPPFILFAKILYLRPLHDRGAKEKCAKILLIEAGNAVNI